MSEEEPRGLCALVRSHAQRSPQALALLAPERAGLSYAGLLDQMQRIAAALSSAGVRQGERVAVALRNGPEMASAMLGVATFGVCAPLNPPAREAEWRALLEAVRPKALLADAGALASAGNIARQLGISCLHAACDDASPAGSFDIAALEPVLAISPREGDDHAIVLRTSGTTSKPKLVPLTHRNLLASARNVATSLRLQPSDRCLNLMPLDHGHGLVGALCASLWAGASIVCTSGMRVGCLHEWLEALQPTWYSAVPAIHEAVLRELAARQPRRTSLRFARSSSAALPRRLALELEAALGVPLIEAYGMSEATHQIATNPLPPGVRKAGTVGRPCGTEVAIMNEAGDLLPQSELGEIVLRGDNVMAGYLDDAEANRAAFTNGWLRTGDLGYLDDDGYVVIRTRLKEMINRGGEKVSPREVEEALYEHPAVQEAAAFPVPHATLGEDVAAAAVLKGHMSESAEALRRFVFGRLAERKVPSRVLVVDELPKGPSGKLQRNLLAKQLAAGLAIEYVAPRTELEAFVAEAFAEVLGLERVGAHDNFFALGGDSLRGNQLLARLRVRGLEVLPMALFAHPTVAQFALEVEAARARSPLPHALGDIERLDDRRADRLLEIARQRRGGRAGRREER